MSVLPCQRRNCPYVMCDRHSPRFGYICDYCFQELVALGIGTDIEMFMGGAALDAQDVQSAHDVFNAEFPIT